MPARDEEPVIIEVCHHDGPFLRLVLDEEEHPSVGWPLIWKKAELEAQFALVHGYAMPEVLGSGNDLSINLDLHTALGTWRIDDECDLAHDAIPGARLKLRHFF